MSEQQDGSQSPTQSDLAGFSTPEELAQAYKQLEGRYGSSSAEAKRLNQELQSLRQSFQTEAIPRQEIKNRSRAEDRLTEFGIPVDALKEYIVPIAEQIAEQKYGPVQRGLQARQRMLAEYPDYSKYEADMSNFVMSDPEISARVDRIAKNDPDLALEYAMLKFSQSQKKSRRSSDSSREEAAHAALPSGRNGDARRQPDEGSRGVQEAAELYRQAPNKFTAQQYAKARLKTVISDDFLNQ